MEVVANSKIDEYRLVRMKGGQRVLQQQVELEERIRQLHDMELDRAGDAEIDAEMRERYRELAEACRGWDAENAQLSSGFGSKVRGLL